MHRNSHDDIVTAMEEEGFVLHFTENLLHNIVRQSNITFRKPMLSISSIQVISIAY